VKKICFALVLIITAVSCSSNSSPPDELIDEETYKQMFMEFAIINQLDQQLLQNTSRKELRQIVYSHYGVTEEEFRISHEYYEQQVENQIERVREMSKILRAERDSVLVVDRKYQELESQEQADSLRQALFNNE